MGDRDPGTAALRLSCPSATDSVLPKSHRTPGWLGAGGLHYPWNGRARLRQVAQWSRAGPLKSDKPGSKCQLCPFLHVPSDS